MTDRDAEINAVLEALKNDTPYIERPNELRVDVGGACFLDRNRMCGPDCAAYTDAAAPTAAERCTILVGINTGMVLLGELVRTAAPRRPSWKPPQVEPPDPLGARR